MSFTTRLTREWLSPHGARVILEQPVRGQPYELWRLTRSGRGKFKIRTLQARTLVTACAELVADGYEPMDSVGS